MLMRLIIGWVQMFDRSEEHTSELQSRLHLVCRLLHETKKYGTPRLRITAQLCTDFPAAFRYSIASPTAASRISTAQHSVLRRLVDVPYSSEPVVTIG